ncbi:hypothetical protein [Haloferula sp. A504]|uniref:hypothetical protein n=1 Tax=Haloferula sp. A504 TaxID=3373601 RepID=UPI0031BE688B|nr:hypothetical protein [Verrucomicrobiaceae bacterium E54]
MEFQVKEKPTASHGDCGDMKWFVSTESCANGGYEKPWDFMGKEEFPFRVKCLKAGEFDMAKWVFSGSPPDLLTALVGGIGHFFRH